jgi:hypothetical protein
MYKRGFSRRLGRFRFDSSLLFYEATVSTAEYEIVGKRGQIEKPM